MRAFSLFWISLTLLLVSATAQPQQMYHATRRVGVLEETGSLNSDRKNKIAILATGTAVNPSFVLVPGDSVKVLSRAVFDRRESIMNTKTGKAFEDMRVLYHCVLLEGQAEPNKGRKGWAVLKREVTGLYSDEFLTPAATDQE